MQKKKQVSGSIFQFYIPQINKYGYCKFFDFREISIIDGLLGQVFDKFSDDEIVEIDEFKYCEFLYGKRCVHKFPGFKNNQFWKYLGNLTTENDSIIPDFKGVQKSISIVEDETKLQPWYSIHNLTERGNDCDYLKVSHLERKILTSAFYGIVWRTGMEYCRKNNLKISDYYDLSDVGIKNTYLQMINVPIYSQIAAEIRDKAIVC